MRCPHEVEDTNNFDFQKESAIPNEDQEEAMNREDLNLNKIGDCCSALESELEQLSTDSRINLADCAEKAESQVRPAEGQ